MTNDKQISSINASKPARIYDLEERTFEFAKQVRLFVKTIPRGAANEEDARQLIRSSGSVGANYIEANEALGKRDFLMKCRISRKEAKESAYWLRLIIEGNQWDGKPLGQDLLSEAIELKRILSAIIEKTKERRP